jgi:hypothetical protein
MAHDMKRYEAVVEVEGQPIEVLFIERERRGNSRIHVFAEAGSETIMDDLVNRRNRPRDAWKATALRSLRQLGFDPLDLAARMRWSQRAGCKCGCSPGFVMNDYTFRGLGHSGTPLVEFGYDVFITPQPKNPLPPTA